MSSVHGDFCPACHGGGTLTCAGCGGAGMGLNYAGEADVCPACGGSGATACGECHGAEAAAPVVHGGMGSSGCTQCGGCAGFWTGPGGTLCGSCGHRSSDHIR